MQALVIKSPDNITFSLNLRSPIHVNERIAFLLSSPPSSTAAPHSLTCPLSVSPTLSLLEISGRTAVAFAWVPHSRDGAR